MEYMLQTWGDFTVQVIIAIATIKGVIANTIVCTISYNILSYINIQLKYDYILHNPDYHTWEIFGGGNFGKPYR